MQLKAANVKLYDIVHYNRKKSPHELQSFFILMEVYGC